MALPKKAAPVAAAPRAALTPAQVQALRARKQQTAAPAQQVRKPAPAAAKSRTAAVAQPNVDPQSVLDWRQVLEDYESLGGPTEFYKLQPGMNHVRFLMDVSGFTFYLCALQSFVPNCNDDGSRGRFFVSPRTLDPNAECPLTQMSERLSKLAAAYKSVDPAYASMAEEHARSLRPSETWFSNVLVKENNTWNCRVMQYGRQVFKGLVNSMRHMLDADDGGSVFDQIEDGNIAHPRNGVIVIIEKGGKGLNTSYQVTLTPKPLPATVEQLSHRVNLVERFAPSDVNDIEAALCMAFGADSFADLMADGTDIELPDIGVKERPQATQRAARGSTRARRPVAAVEQTGVAEEEDPAVGTDEAAMPECITLYGQSAEGLDCNICPYAEECQALSSDNG